MRVLNRLLVEDGRTQMPYAIARNEVSNGAGGSLRLGFGELDSPEALEACAAVSSRSTPRTCRAEIAAIHRVRMTSITIAMI